MPTDLSQALNDPIVGPSNQTKVDAIRRIGAMMGAGAIGGAGLAAVGHLGGMFTDPVPSPKPQATFVRVPVPVGGRERERERGGPLKSAAAGCAAAVKQALAPMGGGSTGVASSLSASSLGSHSATNFMGTGMTGGQARAGGAGGSSILGSQNFSMPRAPARQLGTAPSPRAARMNDAAMAYKQRQMTAERPQLQSRLAANGNGAAAAALGAIDGPTPAAPAARPTTSTPTPATARTASRPMPSRPRPAGGGLASVRPGAAMPNGPGAFSSFGGADRTPAAMDRAMPSGPASFAPELPRSPFGSQALRSSSTMPAVPRPPDVSAAPPPPPAPAGPPAPNPWTPRERPSGAPGSAEAATASMEAFQARRDIMLGNTPGPPDLNRRARMRPGGRMLRKGAASLPPPTPPPHAEPGVAAHVADALGAVKPPGGEQSALGGMLFPHGARGMADMPGAIPLAALGTMGAAYGGMSLVNHLFSKQRKGETASELEAARARYHASLLGGYDKQGDAADGESPLDALAEKAASWLGSAAGGYLTLAGGVGLASGMAAYNYTRGHSQARAVGDALQRRREQLAAESPSPVIAIPTPYRVDEGPRGLRKMLRGKHPGLDAKLAGSVAPAAAAQSTLASLQQRRQHFQNQMLTMQNGGKPPGGPAKPAPPAPPKLPSVANNIGG